MENCFISDEELTKVLAKMDAISKDKCTPHFLSVEEVDSTLLALKELYMRRGFGYLHEICREAKKVDTYK